MQRTLLSMRNIITPQRGRRSYVMVRSIILSVSRITHERVNGRRPNIQAWQRGDSVLKWLIFGIDPDSDVDLRSLSYDHAFLTIHMILTRGQRCSGLITLSDRHFTRYTFNHHRTTLQQPWRSLRCFGALVIIIIIIIIIILVVVV